jgi:pilus assembly protein Flp/PilA
MLFTKMYLWVTSMRDREEGQALVEYALILALVSIVAIAALEALGTNVTGRLQEIADKLA